MKIEFDPKKSAKNETERGLPFTLVEEFDFETAVTNEDIRQPYPETRLISTGPLRGRVCVVVYSYIPGGVRVISLRKANQREIAKYEAETMDS